MAASEAAASSSRRRRELWATDADEKLLTYILHRWLTMAEMDVRRLRRKNVKALRLSIEQSEREEAEKAAKVTLLVKQQNHDIRRMADFIDSSSDDSDVTSSPMTPLPPLTPTRRAIVAPVTARAKDRRVSCESRRPLRHCLPI